MSDGTKHGNAGGDGGYERQDLQVSGVLYFLLGLGVVTLLCILGIKGLFAFLEHRERAIQPAVNPLITNVPADTRKIGADPDEYLKKAFPDPRLENDESKNYSKQRLNEEKLLYSYGWVDEKAGTVHIPIARAMDLLVQRGLPVRGRSGIAGGPADKIEIDRKGIKK